jgi:transcriptional regulator with XRE-family HTH domain
MHDIEAALRSELRDPEYAEAYAESFLNTFIATQIKVIREQRAMTQADLAERTGTTQAGISRFENVNYSSWSIRTLTKIARAFSTRLKVSFETYGTLPDEVIQFERAALERVARDQDPGLGEFYQGQALNPARHEAEILQTYQHHPGAIQIAKKRVVNVTDYKQAKVPYSILDGLLSSGQEEPGGLSAACK